MQTPGLPSSHAASTRNAADNSFLEKPSLAAEQFGEVMRRTINDAPAQPQRQNTLHSLLADETARENKTTSDNITAAKKRERAKRNSEHTSTDSPFLGISGASAVTPQPASNQSAAAADDSDGAKGSATSVSDDAAKAETVDEASTDIGPAEHSTQSAPANTDLTALEATTPAGGSEHSPTAATLAAQQLATQTIQASPDDAAITAEKAKAGTDSAQIGDSKDAVDQAGAPPPDPRGTSAAKQDMTMKKADKTPKVAGQTEQDLPGITTTGGEELPKGQKLSSKDDLHGSEKLDSAVIESPVRVLNSTDSPAPTATAATAATPSPAIDSRVLERTHDIVALHAMRLNEYTSDSLHVVVKPGAGIQLSLELRQSARGIEVRAELHKGDFDQLNQYWPELQQRLEARGVRVGTLTTAENFTGGSQQQFQQSKQQFPNQDPLYAGAFAEFALAGSMTEAPAARAARATAYRGWETWA